MRASWIPVVVLAACEHGQTPMADDVPPTDGDLPCTPEFTVEGELIDWDSSRADFLGIDGATITLVGDPSRTITTPPNGRIELCARPDLPLEFVVDNPGDYLDSRISIDPNVLMQPDALSLRALTRARAGAFLAEHGITFMFGLKHLVVLQTADRLSLTIDAPHDTALAGNDDDGDGTLTWAPGNAGRYVLFPNIQISASTVLISGPPNGPLTANVETDQLAMVATQFVLLGP